jgi:RNA polymerase sigma factor (sigma-70 family)
MRAASDSIPTRKSLLYRLKEYDNSESWKEFFDTYWSLIYTMAVKSGLNDAEAQDVVQETIICVARSIPNFHYDPEIGSFKAWMRRLTHWRIIDHVRKREPMEVTLSDLGKNGFELPQLPDAVDSPFEATWDAEWKRAIIDAAAERTKAKVDTKQYQIFDLCTLRRVPAEKIAIMLKTNRGRIYVSNHRVGKIFEQELKALDLNVTL